MAEDQELTPTADALVPGLPLSPKELKFCEAFANPESETFGNATASAGVAGFIQPRSAGWKLRRRPRIIAKLETYHAVVRVIVGKVLSDLEFTRLAGLAKGDLAVAARCSELQGKHIGMFYERNVLTVDSPGVYDERAALDARRITRILLTMPPDPDLLPEAPLLPAAAVEAVPAAGPTRASAADFDALESKPQVPPSAAERK